VDSGLAIPIEFVDVEIVNQGDVIVIGSAGVVIAEYIDGYLFAAIFDVGPERLAYPVLCDFLN